MRIIVAITGASGVEIGIRALEELKKAGIETHTILSEAAKLVMKHETDEKKAMERITRNSDRLYSEKDLDASIASGSYKVDGMIIAPCSMKTLASIATGYADNLVSRAADVQIKQKRTLVLVPRETPLSSIHLENMLKLSNLGVWIIPPVLSFYTQPKTIGDMIANTVGRILDAFGITHKLYRRWEHD
ncbi:MAG: UbiX family flavin prenyltransferase [archaeon]